MSVNLGRIYEGDYGQDLISNFNNNATALEGAISDIDTSLASKVGSNDVVMLREYNGALQYSLDGSEWKSADLTAWGNITGLLNDQIDLRDALNAKAAKATVDSQQIQINNLNTDLGTVSGNVTTLGNSVSTLSGQVESFATQIADMVTSGNIAYIRQVEESGIKYFEWSADNINWVRSVVGDSAEWGNITGNLADQTDLNQAFSNVNADINAVVGRVDTTDSNLGDVASRVGALETTSEANVLAISNLQLNKAEASTVNAHINNTSNPHNVSKAQLGLGNVDNTADADKPLSNVQRASVEDIIDERDLITNLNNVVALWLGTEQDYLSDLDLNINAIYFVSDVVDFALKYFVSSITTENTDLDLISVKYTTTTGGGITNVNVVITNTSESAVNLTFNGGVVITDNSTYNFNSGTYTIAVGSNQTISLASGFSDSEEIQEVDIDIKWK